MSISAECDAGKIICWAEHYPGVAGWVGAIGSFLALIAALTIFLFQYNSEIKARRAARNRQIDVINEVISSIENVTGSFFAVARDRYDGILSEYRSMLLNDPAISAGGDVNIMPVTQWASKRCYDLWKIYFSHTMSAISTAESPKLNPSMTGEEINKLHAVIKRETLIRDTVLIPLRQALADARV